MDKEETLGKCVSEKCEVLAVQISGVYCVLFSARLDGTGEKVRSRLAQHSSIEDWLELETVRPARQGQKRGRGRLVRLCD